MSQENSQVTSETVSEQPTTETTDNSTDVSSLVAESKKYRKRSQDAESRLAELEKKLASAEEAKMIQEGKKDELIAKYQSENESLNANAQKWNKYEETRRNTLLESVPEEEREELARLDLKTLEYVTGKINNTKSNAPEVAGNPRGHKEITKDWTTMNPEELRENWEDIVKTAESKMKKN